MRLASLRARQLHSRSAKEDQKMRVKEVMSRNIDTLAADASIREAARHMREKDTGFIPVSQNDKIIGTVTDRDITIRALAEDKSLDEKVTSIITDKVLYCYEDADVKDVLRNMQEQNVQRLVVLNNDRDKRLAGVVTLSDIADHCQQQDGELCQLICQATRHYH
jgi:predicted transcriptional regulator